MKTSRNYPEGGSGAVSVREAKAHFSALLERAAAGESITITWHGKPRARLGPASPGAPVLKVDWEWLEKMPVRGRKARADAVIREERDARG